MMRVLSLPPGQDCTYAHNHFTSEQPSSPHAHDFHEFFWVEEGEGVHWINGLRQPLRTGDLVLIQARDAHSFSAPPGGGILRIVNFAFAARLWSGLARRCLGGKAAFFAAPLEARHHRLEPDRIAALHAAAHPLRSGRRSLLQIEAFLLFALALLEADRLGPGTGAVPFWIRRACAALAGERRFAAGVSALVRLAGRSPEHVAREFRRHLGRSPTEVVNDLRMAYAAERLATSEEPIVSIALDCGLENLTHFYRLFRERHRCTPRAYRLQQQRVA